MLIVIPLAFLLAVFIVMIGYVWFEEGLRKALFVFGCWFLFVLTTRMIMVIFQIPDHGAITLAILGFSAMGLVLYNFFAGNINKISP